MKKIACIIWATLLSTAFAFAQSDEHLNLLLSEINADSIHQTVLDLQNYGSRFALRDGGNKQVAEYLKQRLNNYGIPAEIDSFYLSQNHWLVENFSSWFYNVKGIMTSANPVDDSLVIIGAHLDAISLNQYYELQSQAPGADDNASGIAVMMEIARVLHNHPTAFGRNIQFIGFDGEELGLFGGHYDAESHLQNNTAIAVMLNNDMVSFQPSDDWRVTLHWYDHSLDILNKAVEICQTYTDIEPFVPTQAENTNAAYSDSYAYATRDFKSVFAIEYTFSTSYHTVHDVADSNNYAYASHIAKYNLAMLAEFARMNGTVSITERDASRPGKIFPNPASDKAVIEFTLSEDCNALLTLTNLSGQTIHTQQLSHLDAGTHLLDLNVTQLAPGIYLCRFQSDNVNWVQKLVVQ